MDHKDTMQRVTDLLRALSHEHRLQILGLLSAEEKSVGELEEILNLPQPAVSQQLARLRLDQLVAARRDGRVIYYKTSTDRLNSLLAEFGEILGYNVNPKSGAPAATLGGQSS